MFDSIKSFRERAESLFGDKVFLVKDFINLNSLPVDYLDNLFFVEIEGSEKVFILSGVHENEVVAPSLLLDYLSKLSTSKGFIFYPVLHQGFAHDSPIQLFERNFFSLEEEPSLESKFFIEFLKKKDYFKYFIDVHENSVNQGLVYTSIVDDNPLSGTDLITSTKVMLNDSIDFVSTNYYKSSFLIELPINHGQEYLSKVLGHFL